MFYIQHVYVILFVLLQYYYDSSPSSSEIIFCSRCIFTLLNKNAIFVFILTNRVEKKN